MIFIVILCCCSCILIINEWVNAANRRQYTWIQTYRFVECFLFLISLVLHGFDDNFGKHEISIVSSMRKHNFCREPNNIHLLFSIFSALFNNFTYLIGHVARVKEL